jgi:hypothetical protein
MRAISIRAVVLATLAVFGIDIVSGFFLMAIFGAPVVQPGMSEEQAQAAVAALLQNPGYLTGVLILGTASTVIGGYLAARLADSVPYFNALAFGALGVFIGALSSAELPTWFRVVGLGVTIPAALAGAHIAKKQRTASGR